MGELVERLRQALLTSQAIIIGAGAGLSTSAGFSYEGERFEKYFSDFEDKYHFHDMYSGGFYPYETLEEKWAFWSRNIFINRYTEAPKPVYENLLELVEDKNYFVTTTNVDHCFQKAGFNKKRLFYTQGDYGLWQCSFPCHNKTYDNEQTVLKMIAEQKDMKVPSELVPYCPKCGRPMEMNLRSDESFVEDEGWHNAMKNYQKFLEDNCEKKVLFLEMGVGMNTPSIIKFPFRRMTLQFPDALYACINQDENEKLIPPDLKGRAIYFHQDIGDVLKGLL